MDQRARLQLRLQQTVEGLSIVVLSYYGVGLVGYLAKGLKGAGVPLDADLVVVDEVSMLDVVLAHHLLKAIQAPTRLVLVGDPDQLPSVSAGNVLPEEPGTLIVTVNEKDNPP